MSRAIIVDHLSKRYRIGRLRHETMLRETIVNLATGKWRRAGGPSEEFWALRDLTFSVDEGEVVGVIGRNGAGKSTLLKVLSRITYPTSGSFAVRGRVASLLEVGTGFHEELTGRENIYLNGSILGMKKRAVDAKFQEIVEFAGVEKFIDTPIKRYSSGMRLRLGFAVAAHLDPEILVVDEVLAVGDAAFQKKCLNAMGQLQSSGRTVLFVSHRMEAIEELCSRALWIDRGKIRRDGEPGTVIQEYLGSFAHAQQAGVSLRDFENRRGNREILVTGVEFLHKDGRPKEVIRAGDGLKVRVHYEAFKSASEPHFGFRLLTDMGTMVTDISTWSTGLTIPRLDPGQGSIDFEIDFLNLMPSRYYLTLWIQGTAPLVHYDLVESCMVFNVEGANYYQSGRGIDRKFGLVFFPGRWLLPVAHQSPASDQP